MSNGTCDAGFIGITNLQFTSQLESLHYQRELNNTTGALSDAQRKIDRLMDHLADLQAEAKGESGEDATDSACKQEGTDVEAYHVLRCCREVSPA